jgi:hypothetical protein
MRGLTRQIFSLKSAAITLAAVFVARDFIKTADMFEQLAIRLETIEGSSKKAEKSLRWVKEFAKDTPFRLSEVTDAFIQMRNFGIEPTDGALQVIGDTAAGMGKDIRQAVEAVGKAMVGENEQLKNFGLVARVEGEKLRLSWEQSGTQFTQTIDRNNRDVIKSTILAIWNQKYAGGMEKMKTSWRGIWSNIGDAWDEFKDNVLNETGLWDALKIGAKTFGIVASKAFDSIMESLKDNQMSAQDWTSGLLSAIDAILVGLDRLVAGIEIVTGLFNQVEIQSLRIQILAVGAQRRLVKPFFGADTSENIQKNRAAILDKEFKRRHLGKPFGDEIAGFEGLLAQYDSFTGTLEELNDRLLELTDKSGGATSALRERIQQLRRDLPTIASLAFETITGKGVAGGVGQFDSGTEAAKKGLSDLEQAGVRAGKSITSAFSDTFATILKGTENARQAFARLGERVLDIMVQVATQQLVLRAIGGIGGALGGFGAASAAPTVPVTMGAGQGAGLGGPGGFGFGVTPFASGGIATSPTNAIVGDTRFGEAIIPLAASGSVPVQFKGGGMGGQTNYYDFSHSVFQDQRILDERLKIIAQRTFNEGLENDGAPRGAVKSARRL